MKYKEQLWQLFSTYIFLHQHCWSLFNFRLEPHTQAEYHHNYVQECQQKLKQSFYSVKIGGAAIFTAIKNTAAVFLAKRVKSGYVFVNFNMKCTIGNILVLVKLHLLHFHNHSSLSFKSWSSSKVHHCQNIDESYLRLEQADGLTKFI